MKNIPMFNEFITEAVVSVPEIRSVADVRKFFHYLIYDLRLNMHPDTPFSDYVETGTDRPTFDARTADRLDAAMGLCFTVCEDAGEDVYDVGFQIMKDFMKDAYGVEIGSEADMQESVKPHGAVEEMDLSFAGGEIATNFEAIVAIGTILLGLTGLALNTFKDELKNAFKKQGPERSKAIERVLVDTREKIKNAA